MGVGPTEVVEPVSDIRRLLYLEEQAAGTDGVDLTCREVKDIPPLGVVAVDVVHHSIALDQLSQLLRVRLPRPAGADGGIRSRVEEVPHLRLASRVLLLAGVVVVGMDLYGEILPRVDDLDEEGEGVPEALPDVMPEEPIAILLGERR